MNSFTELEVEEAALEWLRGLGYTVVHGPEIAPGSDRAERGNYGEVTLRAIAQALVAKVRAGQAGEGHADGAGSGRGAGTRTHGRPRTDTDTTAICLRPVRVSPCKSVFVRVPFYAGVSL
jgi:hypothetical protein